MSTYVMPPFVWLSVAATPELPRAPTPVGQLTATPLPTLLFHCRLTAFRYSVRLYVVPLLSLRWITVMSRSGNDLPLFSFFSAGSFHFLIRPMKMPATALPSSLMWSGIPSPR
jgi:hypothetical protein